MKIAYILDDDISQETGIVKKIKSKITIWQDLGHDVKVFSLRSKSCDSVISNSVIISQFTNQSNLFQKFYRQFKNSKILEKHLAIFQPDIIYIRYMKYYPNLVKVLKKHAPYIVEINSNDVEEEKLNRKIVYFYNILTRGYFLRNATAFLSVSKELAKHSNFSKYMKPTLTIGNGFDFTSVKKYKKEYNDPLEFIFIGTPGQVWHGIDKIIFLAQELPEYSFHIVGPSAEEIDMYCEKKPENVIIHGYCDQEYVENLILKSDIGISTLALHRKNMNEASPLKSRQYLAHGLPIIVGYEDTDIPDNMHFILNIGNYEQNVFDSIGKIKKFISQIKNISPNTIVEESKQYLDQANKEKLRLKFFKEVVYA